MYSAFLVWYTTQSALQCIITPVTGFNINPALIVHFLNSLGSILARCYFRGAHMPHHATNNIRILLGTHLYTWVESNNVDKVSCWRTKSARHWRESNPEPFDPESRVQSIYHGTSINSVSITHFRKTTTKESMWYVNQTGIMTVTENYLNTRISTPLLAFSTLIPMMVHA